MRRARRLPADPPAFLEIFEGVDEEKEVDVRAEATHQRCDLADLGSLLRQPSGGHDDQSQTEARGVYVDDLDAGLAAGYRGRSWRRAQFRLVVPRDGSRRSHCRPRRGADTFLQSERVTAETFSEARRSWEPAEELIRIEVDAIAVGNLAKEHRQWNLRNFQLFANSRRQIGRAVGDDSYLRHRLLTSENIRVVGLTSGDQLDLLGGERRLDARSDGLGQLRRNLRAMVQGDHLGRRGRQLF